jgi:hypothetical protein
MKALINTRCTYAWEVCKKNARVIYKKVCARIKLHRPTKINNQTNKAQSNSTSP